MFIITTEKEMMFNIKFPDEVTRIDQELVPDHTVMHLRFEDAEFCFSVWHDNNADTWDWDSSGYDEVHSGENVSLSSLIEDIKFFSSFTLSPKGESRERPGIDTLYVPSEFLREAEENGGGRAVRILRAKHDAINKYMGMYLTEMELDMIARHLTFWRTQDLYRNYIARIREEKEWAKQLEEELLEA